MSENSEVTSDSEPKSPISLDSRLSKLGHVETSGKDVTAQTIADTIGTYPHWVTRKIEEFDIPHSGLREEATGRTMKLYPPVILELLKDEREWYDFYESLPDRVSPYVISESIGRSYGWTRKTLDDLGARPTLTDDERKSLLYPKYYAKKLRDIDLSTPMDNGWVTLTALVELTSKDREWIERRLEVLGIEGEARRAAISGRVFTHYPPETIEQIIQMAEERAPFGGEWLTAYRISTILPRSENWINRILIAEFSDSGEVRQDDQGVDRIHYPPQVLQELWARINQLDEYQPSGEYLVISKLARNLGRSTLWVMNRVDKIHSKPEVRLDGKGRPKVHYPPESVRELLELPDDILKIQH